MTQSFGPYDVIGPLGEGGMGSVYACQHRHLSRRAAVKVPLAWQDADEGDRARFRREAQAVAGLDHPHIVRVFDAHLDEDPPWIAMELVEGTDLGRLLKARSLLPVERTVQLLEPVAQALDLVHRHGLTHRDVKPSNILIGRRDGREWPVLTDFGIVRASAGSTLTPTGLLVGSAGYISPEQVRGGEAGPASDLYALACVAFQCLTGMPPFVGDPMTVATAHAGQQAPAPSAVNTRLDPRIDAVFAAALCKSPEERLRSFPTASAFVSALGRAEDLSRTAVLEPVGSDSGRAVLLSPPRSSRTAVVVALGVALIGTPAAYVAADALVDRSVTPTAVTGVDDVLREGAVLTPGQRALLEQGPLSSVVDCVGQPEAERGTVSAAVGCSSTMPGVDSFLLRQSGPGETLRELMDSPSRAAGDCAQSVGVDATWARGPLACYDNQGESIAALWFGFEDSGVSLVAIRDDSRNDLLHEWFTAREWVTPAGP